MIPNRVLWISMIGPLRCGDVGNGFALANDSHDRRLFRLSTVTALPFTITPHPHLSPGQPVTVKQEETLQTL